MLANNLKIIQCLIDIWRYFELIIDFLGNYIKYDKIEYSHICMFLEIFK